MPNAAHGRSIMKYSHRLALLVLTIVQSCLPATASAAQLLVANADDGTASFIDPDSGATLITVKLIGKPSEIALTNDHKFAFVSNYDAPIKNTVSVIDIRRRNEGRRVGSETYGPAMSEVARPHLTYA